eukprot:symbB.v1.2.010011.t1/scaffold645.1/size176818/10
MSCEWPSSRWRAGNDYGGARHVEAIILDLFKKYDQDSSQFLDPIEFKALMQDLQQRLDFPKDEILLFLAEADMNADGKIEYEEFIPLALQIIQGMYAKKRLEQHLVDVDLQAEELLVHGMSREELTALVGSMFERMDEDIPSGKLLWSLAPMENDAACKFNDVMGGQMGKEGLTVQCFLAHCKTLKHHRVPLSILEKVNAGDFEELVSTS